MNAKTTTAPTATKTRKPAEARLFKAKDRITGDVVYVNAMNRSQTENFITYRRFEISILSVKEAIGLKAEDILDATAQPGPEQQMQLPSL